MRSNRRTDEEIDAVAQVWNTEGSKDPHSQENLIASAVYHALRWARGCREGDPRSIVSAGYERETRRGRAAA